MTESPQQLNSLDCWDYTIELECLKGIEDLQLAAELGKTLLERNKDLENSIKQYQNVIDDQSQEIEYLTKQTVALREVNDSRLRIYEQLEVSIQDLERANHRLAVENANDKKQIKNLTVNIDTLESRCEELQSTVDELTVQIDAYKRKAQKAQTELTAIKDDTTAHSAIIANDNNDSRCVAKQKSPVTHRNQDECDGSPLSNAPKRIEEISKVSTPKTAEKRSLNDDQINETTPNDHKVEETLQLLAQLRETRAQIARDQRRITDLQEQIDTYVQRIQGLEKELSYHRKEDAKNMQEELDELRQGQMCSRCLRLLESPKTDDMSMSLCDELEDDDASMMEAICSRAQYRTSFSLDVQEPPKAPPRDVYKDFLEKYEALVEIKCNPNKQHQSKAENCRSLQEELRMSSDFNSASVKDTDDESGHGDSVKPLKKNAKITAHTPTDFSEAETSSSGFSDETSNKATQTDGPPGSFLCAIVDGAEAINIYDDASPVEGRFRDRPEFRELFREIFSTLQKAAANKDEHEEPLKLDDHKPASSTPKVPPVTPSTEGLPDFPDDAQSVVSSTMSELSLSNIDPPTLVADKSTETFEQAVVHEAKEPERVLKPYRRAPLEYLSVSVRKRSSSRKKRQFADRSDSPVTHIVGSPKITYSNRPSSGRRRRDFKNAPNESDAAWNGNTMHFFATNRNSDSPTPAVSGNESLFEDGFEFKPSAALHDLHKLKRLDLTYAEALRNADAKKKEQMRYRRK